MNDKELNYLLTESNLVEVYKQLTGLPLNKELTKDEIEAIKKRFWELADFKSK